MLKICKIPVYSPFTIVIKPVKNCSKNSYKNLKYVSILHLNYLIFIILSKAEKEL